MTNEAETLLTREDLVWGREVEELIVSLILCVFTAFDLCNFRARHKDWVDVSKNVIT
jgi:hypothetical protein